jgi:hypothetical protein
VGFALCRDESFIGFNLIGKLVWEAKWAEAKKLCRLNNEEIEMAKKLGSSPKG